VSIESLMKECNNYFYKWKESDIFTIDNNSIAIVGVYLPSQYVRIVGSIMNDGVYQVETYTSGTITILGLNNEVFEGSIYGLSVPKDFIELEIKIETYNDKNVISNKSSEGFNNYSVGYAKDKNGKPLQWQEIFKSDINIFRQMYDGERWVIEI